MAGKPTAYCQVCLRQGREGKCYRLQVQHSHKAGIKKEYRDLEPEQRPEGAREAPRCDVLDYVHCPQRGKPRHLQGHPSAPERPSAQALASVSANP